MTGTDVTISRPVSPIPSPAEARAIFDLASTFASSGLFRDARQASQAFVKIVAGRDLGLTATAAMTGIHIVEGKPELSANLQAAMVRQFRSDDGWRYDYVVEQLDNEGCVLRFERRYPGYPKVPAEVLGKSSFTQEDVRRAELGKPTAKGATSNHQKFPRNMLFARAMTNGTAFYTPEVTYAVRTYAEGEIESQFREVAPAAGEPAAAAVEPDVRPARLALREVFRGRGLKGPEITRLVNAALDDEGIEVGNADLDQRLRLADEPALVRIAEALGEVADEIVDVEVVPEAEPQVTQAQLDAFEDELIKESAATTAAAIEGGGSDGAA